MLFNIYFSTEFDARMQEMAFSGFQIPKFSGGACPQTTLGEVLPPPTLIGLPPTSELIETPEYVYYFLLLFSLLHALYSKM